MITLLKLLIFGHLCRFEVIYENRLTDGERIGMRYVSRCSKCGKIKWKDVI